MHIIWTIILGFIIGLVARFLRPGRDPAGFIVTTLLGIAGAFLGAFLGRTLGFYTEGEPAGFVMSVIGAIILLFVYHMVATKKSAV